MRFLKNVRVTVAAIALLVAPTVAHASSYAYTPEYWFTGGSDGGAPNASLTLLGASNPQTALMWGTTQSGGASNHGVIFNFSPFSYAEHAVASFPGPPGGVNPNSPLLYATYLKGNGMKQATFFGTTANGGTHGQGTVFGYDPNGGAIYTLYNFTGGTDGNGPVGSLVFANGKIWGVTTHGGLYGQGTVYSVDLAGNETAVYSFHDYTTGVWPRAGLMQQGNLIYGTTSQGGTGIYAGGLVFSVDPVSGLENTTCLFQKSTNQYWYSGAIPSTDLVSTSNGMLYGATMSDQVLADGTVYFCNSNNGASVFEHRFTADGNGAFPTGTIDIHNNFVYGATQYAALPWVTGTLYSFDMNSWSLITLHTFTQAEGTYDLSGVTFFANGIYGVTTSGGAGHGTIFRCDTFLSAGVRHHPVSGHGQSLNGGAPMFRRP